MNVSLAPTWEKFVASQVRAGEFGNASEVVREALRLLRDQQEARSREELRGAFADVDSHGANGEPTAEERATIENVIRRRRAKQVRA